MKIEDYWNDGMVYEVEYEVVLNNQKKIYNRFICCSQELDKDYVNNTAREKINSKFKNCESVNINEIYDVLIDKIVLESKIVYPLEKFSLFRISFSTCQNNKVKEIDKMIVIKKDTPHEKLIMDIKQKFSNVKEVLIVQHIENTMALV